MARMQGFSARQWALGASLAASVLAGAAVDAATIPFSDNFDSYGATDLDWAPPAPWEVVNGTVDLVKDGDYDIRCYGNAGSCVDLDGTTNDSGVMRTIASDPFTLVGGQTYRLEAQISGNQRSAGTDDVVFGFRNGASPLTSMLVEDIAANATFTLYTLVYTPSTTITTAQIFFSNAGGRDNQGPILDNVRLTAVPLPAAAWLMLSGLVGLGAVGRRRVRVTEASVAAA